MEWWKELRLGAQVAWVQFSAPPLTQRVTRQVTKPLCASLLSSVK